MKEIWLNKIEELAVFNADKDKSKYNDSYLKKMAGLQKEYDERQLAYASFLDKRNKDVLAQHAAAIQKSINAFNRVVAVLTKT